MGHKKHSMRLKPRNSGNKGQEEGPQLEACLEAGCGRATRIEKGSLAKDGHGHAGQERSAESVKSLVRLVHQLECECWETMSGFPTIHTLKPNSHHEAIKVGTLMELVSL